MKTKYLSIPFRRITSLNDTTCHDGEIAAANGVEISDSSSIPTIDNENPGNGSNNGNPSVDNENTGNGSNTEYPSYGNSFTFEKDYSPSLPPAPDIQFSLLKTTLPGWHIHCDILPAMTVESDVKTSSAWGDKAMETLAVFRQSAMETNLFTEPFLVMAAWRTIDGHHLMPTPPVLMIPNSGPLMVAGSVDFAIQSMEMKIVAAVCRLQYKLRRDERLREWSDRLTHLDILMSKPLSLFNPKGIMGIARQKVSDCFTHSTHPDSGEAGEQPVSVDRYPQTWIAPLSSGYSLMTDLISIGGFHIVSEIPFAKLMDMKEFGDVEFNRGNIVDVLAGKEIQPDFSQLSKVTAKGKTEFSGRSTLFDLTLSTPAYESLEKSCALVSDYNTYSPRWIFHPDPDATEFCFTSPSGQRLSIPLSKHPSLYGSYFYGGLASVCLSPGATDSISNGIKTKNIPSAVWRSVKGNGLVLTDKLLMKLDVGRVIAVCRAFRASGLVATTAPTAYAFTDEGVFLIKEQDDGTFRDAGLITGYILKDIDSLILLPNGVKFTTSGNQTVSIVGTSIKNLSGETSSSTSVAGGSPVTLLGTGSEACIETRPLKLNDPEGLKRIRKVTLRGVFQPKEVEMSLYGSRDLQKWFLIGKRKGGAEVAPPDSLFRFFKVGVKTVLQESDSLHALGVVLY